MIEVAGEERLETVAEVLMLALAITRIVDPISASLST